ncbi:MAG: 50S ribosomal protein L20 [Thermodesulfovibrionales bacterium]|nr:50S ribosomal protein L20 [Thermodesulfovibrionales bacterium]
MPRAKGGYKTRRRRKKVLERAKGFFGARSRLFTVATEAVDHALLHAYKDRKIKKRNFRALWIVRINAAARTAGLTYGQMINGLKKANIGLNRKSIADMAYNDPKSFSALADKVKETLAA